MEKLSGEANVSVANVKVRSTGRQQNAPEWIADLLQTVLDDYERDGIDGAHGFASTAS